MVLVAVNRSKLPGALARPPDWGGRIVIDANNQQTVYRFWNHYFAPDDIGEMFGEAGFSGVKRFDSLLNANELYNDTDVTCYEAKK